MSKRLQMTPRHTYPVKDLFKVISWKDPSPTAVIDFTPLIGHTHL